MNQQEQILPMSAFMDLDRSGPIPLYFQVAQKIEQAIMDGTLPAGSRLENEVALGERLGLSRPTVRRAIQDLVDKGLLVRRRGIGTQVVHGQVTRGVELTSLYEDLARSGQKPSTALIDYKIQKADAKIAEKLGVAVGANVLYVKRLRSADNVAVSILENWLPTEFTDITPGATEDGLSSILIGRLFRNSSNVADTYNVSGNKCGLLYIDGAVTDGDNVISMENLFGDLAQKYTKKK